MAVVFLFLFLPCETREQLHEPHSLTHLQTRVRVVDDLVSFHVDDPIHAVTPLPTAWHTARAVIARIGEQATLRQDGSDRATREWDS